MALKPWYKVITPREDLREGKPLDASEFAVHLDQVRDGKAPSVYQNAEEFFERTFMTKGLTDLAAEVVRRLSGLTTETSAVFNMTTQFGGGKTHALTLLYHLAHQGSKANDWKGVPNALKKAGLKKVPEAATAVFVGTEFDSLTGRGGDDGTPLRKTPWGEIAFQIGGKKAFEFVAEHDKQSVAPGGDVINKFLPDKEPCLILMDELMNYISRNRKSGMATQLYDFLHNLSECARNRTHVVLAVSIPASELEMSQEDQADHERLKKLLDRVGKAVVMASETETSEIIRRRLFEWGGLPDEARKTIGEFSDWLNDHRKQVPEWFPVDNARDSFAATYPFHPTVISVFERKWQALPRFQRTRGILRLLALWVSKAYQDGYQGAHHDQLIGLGTAPLDDPTFRAAMFEQLGESKLEVAVTTDICGKSDAHAIRLDAEATPEIKKARLHRKVATTIFFESNGGQTSDQATMPEIRLAIGEPGLDTGNIDTVIENLSPPNGACYYLENRKSRYCFTLRPNLTKVLADRKSNIRDDRIEECVRADIQKVFAKGSGADRVYFPKDSGQVPDKPVLAFVVLPPERNIQDKGTMALLDSMTKTHGLAARVFKSALIFCVPDSPGPLYDDARKVLAWKDIQAEQNDLRLDDDQKGELSRNLKKAEFDLLETIWRTYKNLVYLDKSNQLTTMDLGLVHSSSADYLLQLFIRNLSELDIVSETVSTRLLVGNWPPAFVEWSTLATRNAFFSSPLFPRLLNSSALIETIKLGVESKVLGYVGKTGDGKYDPFYYGESLSPSEIEITDQMFLITKATAEEYLNLLKEPPKPEPEKKPDEKPPMPDERKEPPKPPVHETKSITWTGEIPWQKWGVFYNKVLTRYATGKGLKMTLTLTATVEASEGAGISNQQIEETKVALRELGLKDELDD